MDWLSIPGVADPVAAALLCAAAFAGGIVRGFTGFGFGMVFVPVASMAVGPAAAVGLIWFIDLPYAFPLAARSFPRAVWREVGPLLIGSVIALPLGVYLLTRLDRDLTRWIIATVIALALAAMISGWRYRSEPGVKLSLSVGGLSGLFNGLAQLGGMPLALFWLSSQTNSAQRTRDNLLVFFALNTLVSGLLFMAAGVVTMERFWTAIPLIIIYGAGLLIGVRGFHIASEQTFRRAAYAVIGASVLLALPVFDAWIR
ncbi:sulfite exporter TauE/SafE family protein [Terrarubrum flagellatum]|uniref:sulfite exporter TauE/SafE family protein n=1 Tax=Terrirubrum flagellatum TaxID=2895980 RepID=UPI0031451194